MQNETKENHVHCRCMNIGGQCPNRHYTDCNLCKPNGNDLKKQEIPANRPICPECGCNTIVLFTPPKADSIKNHVDISSQEYVDWSRAHLYCCNGESNCKNTFGLMNFELCTPLNGKKIKYFNPK